MKVRNIIILIVVGLFNFTNLYAIDPEIFVQSTVNRASQVLSEKISKESKMIKLQEIAIATQNYTGADLAALCREAAVSAMRNKSPKINSRDFANSLKQIKPSITTEVDQWYNTIRESISNVVPKTGEKAFYG